MPFNWTGWYVGVNGGLGWAGSNSEGMLVGGTLVYNYQIDSIVIGAEGDYDFASLGGRSSDGLGDFSKTRLTSVMTERIRVGYAIDRTLLYVTGGYAGGTVHSSLATPGFYTSQDNWRNGYALGGGIEYAFTSHISAKAEYIYSRLGSQTIFAGPVSTNSSMNASTFRLGLNYRF